MDWSHHLDLGTKRWSCGQSQEYVYIKTCNSYGLEPHHAHAGRAANSMYALLVQFLPKSVPCTVRALRICRCQAYIQTKMQQRKGCLSDAQPASFPDPCERHVFATNFKTEAASCPKLHDRDRQTLVASASYLGSCSSYGQCRHLLPAAKPAYSVA